MGWKLISLNQIQISVGRKQDSKIVRKKIEEWILNLRKIKKCHYAPIK